MDAITITLIEWSLTGILGVIAANLWRQLSRMKRNAAEREQRNQREFDALKRGLQMQLRADLVDMHHRWIVELGYMPVDAKRLWHDMFCAYEELGENGVISALYDDVKEAHVAPDTPPARRQ